MVNVQCSLLWPRHQPSNEATEKLLVVAKIVGTLLLRLMIIVATEAEAEQDTDIAFSIRSVFYCILHVL